MKTDLDHLPSQKQRELQHVVRVLFEEFEREIGLATQSWKKRGRILKVILYGSYCIRHVTSRLRLDTRFPWKIAWPKGSIPQHAPRGCFVMRPTISVLLSVNDLEADAIYALARTTKGVEPKDLGLDWSGSVAAALAGIDIDRLAPTVILVECPCPAFERAVEQSGRTLHVVDHHLRLTGDGQLIDRRSRWSALEQVKQLLGAGKPDPEHQRIAANDSGFWRGLFAELQHGDGDVVEATKKYRLLDIAAVLRGKSDPRQRRADLSTFAAEAQVAFDEAVRAYASALEQQRAVIARPLGRLHATDQPVFVLVETDCDTPFLADAIYYHHLTQAKAKLGGQRLNAAHCDLQLCIVRFAGVGAQRKAVELFLSAGSDLGDSIIPLVEKLRTLPAAAGASIYGGAGPQAAFLGISSDRDISALVDTVLGDRMKGERPLAAWSSQFFQIVRAEDKDWFCPTDTVLAEKGWQRLCPSDQTRGYFLPAIRERLAEAPAAGADEAAHRFDIRSYELADIHGYFKISWPRKARAARTIVPLNRLRIHILEAQRMIAIEWIVGGLPGDAEQSLWSAMIAAHGQRVAASVSTVADLLDCNEALRFVTSPFRNLSKSWVSWLTLGEGASAVGLQVGYAAHAQLDRPKGWFAALAERALAPLGLQPDQVTLQFDPRARSVHAMVPCGNAPVTAAGIAREDALLSRLAGVDSYDGGGPPYDRAFNDAELERWRYRRFAEWGTHFAASGYSFAALAYGKFATERITETNWFNGNKCVPHYLATGHVQSMYWIMFLITMLHNAVFDALASDHAKAVQARLEAVRSGDRAGEAAAIEDIQQLRRHLTDYLASLWFTDVSPELQGQDLYRRMLEQSGAEARCARLHDAFVDADAVEADQEQRRAEKRRDWIDGVARAFGAPIVALTLAAPIAAIWTGQTTGTATPAGDGGKTLMLTLDSHNGLLDGVSAWGQTVAYVGVLVLVGLTVFGWGAVRRWLAERGRARKVRQGKGRKTPGPGR